MLNSSIQDHNQASAQGLHPHSWLQAINELEANGDTYALITVLGTSGSTPRAIGTKMVISEKNIYATIGGGHLEFKAIEHARELLKQEQTCQAVENFQLGASLGQCCGGTVVVLFEVFVNDKMHLDIYGAGHVAQALIPILAQLPIRIRWIDSRADLFPAEVPSNVQKVIDEQPVDQVKSAKKDNAFLILTHNHQLDFDLCQAILKRDDALWMGVIGSDTKAKRFQYRLTQRGFSEQQIEQMICPVGLKEVTGKLPMEVAIAISGQLVELYQSQQTKQSNQQGAQWKSLTNNLIHLSAEQVKAAG
ncbi:xanthine dehydrogenase accessory protein XdhC [Psychromonas algicola]|uniref:xanthine dehydrogenase accessory protein XdhC n=1 Tax=Psychromonas algicola TaxID=2555642 RepID=UPI001067D7BF|nr:xanthine dehydrogenase accessory protein XdhC [Psychromonas sp. RZ5]TEW47093.1 xanthine dehydrogenase accessory protein XdhC [Psychromonas sp. RZ5]